MLYKEFIFSEIDCNENFVKIFSETIKKLERIEDSFEKITGQYNYEYQTLKEKMFEDIEKLFEEEKEEENI
jgi:hypothetical protein